MKKKLKLFFSDFWSVFNIEDNLFLNLIKDDFDIELTDQSPDFLFYSVFGTKHYRHNCIKIFYTGENVRPDFNYCDYAFTFDYIQDRRHFRLPLYAFFDNVGKLLKPKNIEQIISEKLKFCNFVYSNASQPVRNNFFKKLSKYKKVDSAGRLYNNTKFRAASKVDFIKDYKFTIAFENESYPGYTTEKIFEPMLVNSLPIYWGNPLVHLDFNSNSYLNYYDFHNEDDLIDRIIQIDKDVDLYAKYLSEPFFENNQLNPYVQPESIKTKLNEIFSSNIEPNAANMFPNRTQSDILRKTAYSIYDCSYYIKNYSSRIRKFNATKIRLKFKRMFEKK